MATTIDILLTKVIPYSRIVNLAVGALMVIGGIWHCFGGGL